MTFQRFIGPMLALAALVAGASPRPPHPPPPRGNGSGTATCRSIPGDASWPSVDAWAKLNITLGGKLIANTPIAAPCHTTLFGRVNSHFSPDQCAALRNTWFFPETHIPSSSSPMAYPFSNNSCNPFDNSDTPCTIGGHPVYTIDATSVSDFQTAVRFVTDHNIRLVVRNTGHDYLGKSTGAHSLAVWTHNFKDLNVVTYKSKAYSGPAIKVGAGVEAIEAYRYASAHGLNVVGGNCPTVGLAGGYTQGGGHGPFASTHGLSADQVLEWEVVTATGKYLVASATENSDLYWALRGGGGGTFGIVVSVTVKAFKDTITSTASLTVLNNGSNADGIYSSLVPFFRDTLPPLVDAGAFVVWIAAPLGFLISPATAPGVTQATLDALLKPMLVTLDKLGLQYQYASAQYPSFLAAYDAQQLTASWNVSDYNVGSRLIPRTTAKQNTQALVDTLRYISSQTIVSGVSYNLTRGSGITATSSAVAVNPYIRSSLFSVTVGTPIDYADWPQTKKNQDKLTYDLIGSLAKLTPNGGAYLNEADFQQPDFQQVIYGPNYDKLVSIKNKYDPLSIFYAKTGVGSDKWAETSDGRLCKVKG